MADSTKHSDARRASGKQVDNLSDLARELPRLQQLAKAQWGKGNTFTHEDGTVITITNPNYWKAKLRSLSVASDPIKYLADHTKGNDLAKSDSEPK